MGFFAPSFSIEKQIANSLKEIRWNAGNGTTNTTSGSAIIDTNGGISLFTGATAGSTALSRIFTSAIPPFWVNTLGGGAIKWNRRVVLGGTFQCRVRTTNGIGRIQLGRLYTSTTVGDLSVASIALKIENTSVKLQVHNGTSLTTTSSLYTIGDDMVYYMIDSDGVGNVSLYINDLLVGSTSGGPTSEASNNNSGLAVSAENGADAAVQRILCTHFSVWQI